MPEDDEDSIYGEDYLGEAEENDEVDELEEGFMKGYDQENSELCSSCHKVLTGYDDTIEIEINNKLYKFCSERCAIRFKKKNKK
jgi:hypothetical protein